MNRAAIRSKFYAENPEITERILPATVLNEWMLTANKEICCETRCIVSNESKVINSIEDVQFYNLESNISRFHDIDDMPGGGVYYNGKPLIKTSAGEMNRIASGWKSWASGTPKRYWRRVGYLWLDRKPDTDDIEIEVDCILEPEDFDNDADEPFDGLAHLQAFADGINKYLQYRAKLKLGKEGEGAAAFKFYVDYVSWMKKRVKGAKYGPISIQPSGTGGSNA